RNGEAHRSEWRQVFLRPRRRAPRQFRAQVQGPGRGDLRYFKTRLAGNGRLQEIVRTSPAGGPGRLLPRPGPRRAGGMGGGAGAARGPPPPPGGGGGGGGGAWCGEI